MSAAPMDKEIAQDRTCLSARYFRGCRQVWACAGKLLSRSADLMCDHQSSPRFNAGKNVRILGRKPTVKSRETIFENEEVFVNVTR